jgi:hypothetical protein
MSSQMPHDIGKIFDDDVRINLALAKGTLAALRRHKQAGVPAAAWRNGKAVLVPPEEIDVASLERRIGQMSKTLKRRRTIRVRRRK